MFRTIPRRTAFLGALLAVAGCTALQQTPLVTTGSTGTTTVVGSSPAATPTPAPKVASIALDPTEIELNSPYSFGGYQSETEAGLGDWSVAGYPTTARLWPNLKDADGKRIATADLDWFSSNPELVTVDQTGWIRSVDPGTSGTLVITARLKSDPAILATASVVLRNDGKLSLELK